jgi:hypothetical protein
MTPTPRIREPLPSRYWDGQFSESSTPDIIAWKLARSAIEHENNLVNHRITWFLAIQGFLFSAFVLIFGTWSKVEFVKSEILVPLLLIVVSCFAGYFSIMTHFGLKRAYLANLEVTLKYRRLCLAHPPDPIVPPLHYWSTPAPVNYQHLPASTILLWLVIVFSCIAYKFPASREFLARLTVENALYTLGLVLSLGLGFALRGNKLVRKLDENAGIDNDN